MTTSLFNLLNSSGRSSVSICSNLTIELRRESICCRSRKPSLLIVTMTKECSRKTMSMLLSKVTKIFFLSCWQTLEPIQNNSSLKKGYAISREYILGCLIEQFIGSGKIRGCRWCSTYLLQFLPQLIKQTCACFTLKLMKHFSQYSIA